MVSVDNLESAIRIEDPDFYINDPYPVLSRLRSEMPVLWSESGNCWILSKYNDVRNVSRSPETFTVKNGILLNDAIYGNVVDSFFPAGSELLSTQDPPRHGELRRPLSPVFTSRAIAAIEPEVRQYCRELLASITTDEPFDAVELLSIPLPIVVVTRLLGLPESSVPDIRKWTDEVQKQGGPLTKSELQQVAASLAPLDDFLTRAIEFKRSHPGNDLITILIRAQESGRNLTDANILMLVRVILVAGNDTTRNLLSGIVWALATNPEELYKLHRAPTLASGAVEETLRWITPVPGFIRTAVHDVELRGRKISKGEHVYLLYMSANRDEDVFDDSEAYRVDRPLDPSHLAFGFGHHVCIGASLAKLEARVFVEEIASQVSRIKLAGTDVRVRSVLENGWRHLPVIFE